MLPATAAHAFVADLEVPALAADDEHHLFRALRLRPGEAVTVSDGAGRWRLCRVGASGGLDADGDITDEPRATPAVTVAFAPVKGDRPEWVAQKLTELGVDEIVPLTTRHTVVRWEGDRATKALERLRAVSRAAGMQARLAWLPTVQPLVRFDRFVGERERGTLALAHPGGGPLTLERPVILVGPEGGWAPEEVEMAPATVDLGPTTLRAETAAMAAAVRLTALRNGFPA
jgi:16S rRNA (uracil1498-N3)-methyltransferase